MKRLLKRQTYNAGVRPSGHKISTDGFMKDRGGAIAPSVIRVNGSVEDPPPEAFLEFAGTSSDNHYREYCQRQKLVMHPARMQSGLATFFVKFLTKKGDLVVDPFAGSNTTGAAAEKLKRRWLSVEANAEYAEGSKGRFSAFNK
jgi:DNA modification methylase